MWVLYFRDKKTVYAGTLPMKRQDLIDEIHEAFDEWINRLDGQKYHGGDELGPDAADFRMYAQLTRVQGLTAMHGVIKTRTHKCKFVQWYKRMQRLCSHDVSLAPLAQ